MRILHISDTHGKHNEIEHFPSADVVIHSGDVAAKDTEHEVLEFFDWFCKLDYAHKIFVAGNHDDCLYGGKIEGLPDNVHCLSYSGVEIEGVKFWGIPYFVEDDVNGLLTQSTTEIPLNTSVLISHIPPYGILDRTDNSYGNPDLLQAVLRIKPAYHLFGHIHGAYGMEKVNDTIFVNASLVNEKYEMVNKPFLVDL